MPISVSLRKKPYRVLGRIYGDAVLVTSASTSSRRWASAGNDVSKSAPLFQHKDSAVLVIKID